MLSGYTGGMNKLPFTAYWIELSPAGKRALSAKLNTSVSYMSQIAHGYRRAGASIIMEIADATNGVIRPRDIRN